MGDSAGNKDPFGRRKRISKSPQWWPLGGDWFEGSSAREETEENGKKRYVRYYTGIYYTPDVPPGKITAIKAVYAAICVLALALFVCAGMSDIRGVADKLMALVQGYCVVCVLWLLRKLGAYVAAGNKLTVGEYKNISRSLIRAATAAALGFASAAAVALVQVLLSVPDGILAGLLCVLGYLGSMLCMAGIAVLENRLKYREIPSEKE